MSDLPNLRHPYPEDDCSCCRWAEEELRRRLAENERLREALRKLDEMPVCSGSCIKGDGRLGSLCAPHRLTAAALEEK